MTIKSIIALSALCFAHAVTAQVYNVPSISGGLGINTDPLASGTAYLLEASGTFVFDKSNGRIADAEFLQETVGGPFVEQRSNQTLDVIDLLINGAAIDWLGYNGANWAPHTYSPDHVYRFYVTGTGAPLNLTIADWAPLIPELHESDNVGSLRVTVSAVPDSTSTLWILPAIALLFLAAKKNSSKEVVSC